MRDHLRARPGHTYPLGLTARGSLSPVHHAVTGLRVGGPRSNFAALCRASIARRPLGEVFDPQHPRACGVCAKAVKEANSG